MHSINRYASKLEESTDIISTLKFVFERLMEFGMISLSIFLLFEKSGAENALFLQLRSVSEVCYQKLEVFLDFTEKKHQKNPETGISAC